MSATPVLANVDLQIQNFHLEILCKYQTTIPLKGLWRHGCQVHLVNNANFRGGGRLLELIFAGHVPLAFQNPYPIIVYSVAKYRPHLSHFWENVIFAIPT